MHTAVASLAKAVLSGRGVPRAEAEELACLPRDHIHDLLYWANRIRQHFFGRAVSCCAIVASKLGGCAEDCRFCSQSARYRTHVKGVTVLDEEQIVRAARRAASSGAESFGIVASGRRPTEAEIDRLIPVVRRIRREFELEVCASLGALSADQACCLREAGVTRYNHNLETSRRHFGNIVTTHRYEDRVETIRNVTAAGLALCSGVLFGLGESWLDRVDVAFELRRLGADAVPINFLHPIQGTPLAQAGLIEPLECLHIIALYRFILPTKHIKIAGGRELNLRDLQSWLFYAGATSFLVGSYLTTQGRSPADDRQMVRDLGLELSGRRSADLKQPSYLGASVSSDDV